MNALISHLRTPPLPRRAGAALVLSLALAGALIILAGAPAGAADEATSPAEQAAPTATVSCPTSRGLRAGDEWWLVDSRGLPDCVPEGAPALAVYQYSAAAGDWHKSALAELAAGQGKSTLTCIYVHGNRMDSFDAVERGTRVYAALVHASEHAPAAKPLRFVIYSWPSEKSQGQLRDVRIKADRADTDAFYFASLVNQFPNQGELSLLGYSFGARIVTGALHLRAGGSLEGHKLPEPLPADAAHVRVSLLAAALSNQWILPHERHELAVSQMDHLFLGMNSCDPALQHYRYVDKCEKPEALGFTGVVGVNLLGKVGAELVQLDAAPSNGRTHDELPYYATPNVLAELQRNLLWQPLPAK